MTARQPMGNKNRKDSKLDFSVRLMEHRVVPTFVLDADCRVAMAGGKDNRPARAA